MLDSLEGKRGEVRAKPPIPAISGLFSQPTLVNNVLTLCAVPAIVANGGAAYGELLRRLTGFEGAMLHERCRARGDEACVWQSAAAEIYE